jgi:hypothetical protein
MILPNEATILQSRSARFHLAQISVNISGSVWKSRSVFPGSRAMSAILSMTASGLIWSNTCRDFLESKDGPMTSSIPWNDRYLYRMVKMALGRHCCLNFLDAEYFSFTLPEYLCRGSEFSRRGRQQGFSDEVQKFISHYSISILPASNLAACLYSARAP